MYYREAFIRTAKKILVKTPKRVLAFFAFFGEYFRFKKHSDPSRFDIKFSQTHPCLTDRTGSTPFDQHYTYHPAWAARVLATTRPAYHVDISSLLAFSAMVSAFIPVRFYDYRPANLSLSNYEAGFADLKNLPFSDDSIPSLSCMHTVEHVGLGRYGDELDPGGDIRAMRELKRVLAKGGQLLFVVPVGKPKLIFNAHRIYSYEQVLEYFKGLELLEFSLIPDSGGFIEKADPALVAQQEYGCGCFLFRKN
jgi:SAM-dependent methyltransferase